MPNLPIHPRPLLLVDAATCTAMGVALIAASGPIAGLTQLPAPLLSGAGVALLPVAALMALVASRRPLPAAGLRLVVVGNLLWIAASIALLVGGWVAPNALGTAFVLAQAIAVAALAMLEYLALRRLAAPRGHATLGGAARP
jgi:hypothetical protein